MCGQIRVRVCARTSVVWGPAVCVDSGQAEHAEHSKGQDDEDQLKAWERNLHTTVHRYTQARDTNSNPVLH